MDKKEIILLVAVVLLAITAVIQTVQLVKLSSSPVLVSGSGVSNAQVQTSSGGSGAVASTSLDNLPSMVGGC